VIGEQRRDHDEYVSVPRADRMALVRPLPVLRVSAPIRVNGSPDVEELVVDRDAILVNGNLVEILGCGDDHGRR